MATWAMRERAETAEEKLRKCEAEKRDLEADVRELKRQLAIRTIKADRTPLTDKTTGPFSHLPKPDREWLEKKTRGKTK